jgi:predicted phosphoribosyltransferase
VVRHIADGVTRFRDRADAGRRLADALKRKISAENLYVLGLPRGGLPVAYEVAVALEAPLDVLVVRKLGAPFNPELAVGAVASGGITVYNELILSQLHLAKADLEKTLEAEQAELERRERTYRGDRPFPSLKGTTVILIDDGVATGATMRAAVDAVRAMDPAQLVVAVPTAAEDSVTRIRRSADEVVVLSTPDPYVAVGAWYDYFPQLQDTEVIEILNSAWAREMPKGR